MRWKPAVDFSKCYLSVYPGKEGSVYLTKEIYWLMGWPKRIVAWIMGDRIALSSSLKYGAEVMFSTGGQPYIICDEVSKAIGPGNRAYYSYDEEDYWFYDKKYKQYRKRCYYYFRISRSVPATPISIPRL